MLRKKIIGTFTGAIPAIAVIICVCLALSGYSEPIYSLDNLPEIPKQKELKPLSVNIPVEIADELDEIKEPSEYKDGTYYGSAVGYNGYIKVKVIIKESKIFDISILSHSEDQPYFRNAVNGIIPKMIKQQTTNVDAVSGATFSSNGIIKAVRKALAKAAVNSNDKDKHYDDETEPVIPEIEIPSEDEAVTVPENYVLKDGEYNNDEQMVLCEHPKDTSWAYYLSVKITITDGKIASVKESKKVGKNGGYDNQNNSYLKRAFNGLGSRKGMEAKIIEAQGTAGVDTVTGATVSSISIIESVNIILPTIEKIPVEAPEINEELVIDENQDTENDKNQEIENDVNQEHENDFEIISENEKTEEENTEGETGTGAGTDTDNEPAIKNDDEVILEPDENEENQGKENNE